MKRELDPKVIGIVIGAVAVIALGGLYFGLRGQGDRSGPLVQAKYQGGRGPGGGGGWRPGMTQSQVMAGGAANSVPGSNTGTKPP